MNNNNNELHQKEIKKINDLYEKKRSILIPKTQAKKADNTNIAEDHKFNKLFERPDNYIIYGERKRNENIKKFKEYEASAQENDFLKKCELPLTLDQYEQIIINLESNISGGNVSKDLAFDIVQNLTFIKLDKSQIEKLIDVSILNLKIK